jgi:hypothetical protein
MRARGVVVHPVGEIAVDVEVVGGALRGEVHLPPGVTGVLRFAGRTQELVPGVQAV